MMPISNKLMTPIYVALISISLGGCVTLKARVPRPAAPLQSSAQAGLPSILMSPVKDSRSNEKVGAIGAASLEADSSLADYIQANITNGLVHQGYVVVSSTAGTPAQNMRRILITLQMAHEASFDAVLQPAKGDVTFAVQVFSTQDTALFAQAYSGTYSETVGVHGQSGYEEDVGRILATAADQAIANALQDPQLQAAIRSDVGSVRTSSNN
jgi:hypothetical protein